MYTFKPSLLSCNTRASKAREWSADLYDVGGVRFRIRLGLLPLTGATSTLVEEEPARVRISYGAAASCCLTFPGLDAESAEDPCAFLRDHGIRDAQHLKGFLVGHLRACTAQKPFSLCSLQVKLSMRRSRCGTSCC